jgi:RNA polymerase sigma factor (sigma-70 family)
VWNQPERRGVVGDVPEATELGVLPSSDFDAIYRAVYADAVRLAVALTGDRAASEDLVQEAFTRLFRNFATVERPGGFLRVVLVSLCRNRYRGARRESARLLRIGHSTTADSFGSSLDSACEVLDILDRLPYRQRAVLVQRYWLDWSEAEIAAALDCRPGTVKSLAARALAKLKEDLA